MKRFRGLSAVASIASAAVSLGQVQLNVSVETIGGQNAVGQLSAGDVIEYRVVGTLSPDTGHLGLALAGFNLVYSGGDLAQANTPSVVPEPAGTCVSAMGHFVKPFGITNPAGYSGTIIGGDLVQVGGGQNTIKNVDSADFPTGSVVTGVAQIGGCGPAILVTGSLTIPAGATDGQVFTLTSTELFANVIAPGQTGAEEFWATIEANEGTSTPLTMTVTPICVAMASMASSFPAADTRLWRNTKNRVRITFSTTVGEPNPGDIQIRELLDEGEFGSDLSGSFTATVDGAELVLTDNASTLENRKWYRVSGTWPCVEAFALDFLVQMGDANNDGFTNFTDLSAINPSIPTFPAGLNETNIRGDVNGDGFINFTDLSVANSFIPGFPVPKPTGH